MSDEGTQSVRGADHPGTETRDGAAGEGVPGPVPELLREWRLERGMSQGAVALKAGLSRAAVSRWESGKRRPRPFELRAVLDALRVPPAGRAPLFLLLGYGEALADLADGAPASRPEGGVAGSEAATEADLVRSAADALPGRRLVSLRLRRGWTQGDLAARMGVAQGTISKWEKSTDWPDEERLERLCELLGASEGDRRALHWWSEKRAG